MRNNIFPIILSIHLLTFPLASFSQGWVAEVDLQIDHYHYAQSKISSATFSFSGVSVSGSSSSNTLRLTATGNTPISGVITLSILGIASSPYDPIADPTHQPISVFFSENYTTPCVTGYFQKKGESQWEQASFRIRIYPRMEISEFVNECDKITLSTTTCAPSLFWEVSESMTGGFKVIPSKSTSSMTITIDELKALGLANVYGRKYFRVTGRDNTTSEAEPIDIYYPPPLAVVTPTPPRCHGGTDGTVKLDITSSLPSIINDFVLTIFPADSLTKPVKQDYLQDGFSMTITGLAAKNYMVIVQNNSMRDTYGPCQAKFYFEVKNPEPVAISEAVISDNNGYAIKCSGGSDGKIEVHPSGGTGTYSTFEWTPAVSTTEEATNLSQGVYNVKVQDSGGCWSELYRYSLSEPKKLSVVLASTGGKNGYDVSCLDTKDGKIETAVLGGAPQYNFRWSDGVMDPVRQKLGPGEYTITVTDANGCAATGS
ncbi:MAG TPA: SprB repeat-containing protein, partial [Chryseosolibacter sp.]